MAALGIAYHIPGPIGGLSMRPLRAFRTSLYLSLAIAILAIGVAGGDLLPELPFLTGFSLLVLAGAYVIDGRWQLSLRHANLVGMGLASLLGLWAIFQVVRPPTGIAETLPWPASALPYLAPVVMILIPAKMLRPKHIGDYWTMFGLSLLAMALACAMAMDGVFVLIFAAYTITFIWSLVAFQLCRELGPTMTDPSLSLGRRSALRPALFGAAIAGVSAIPLFWATPRSGADWELAINTRGHSIMGISDGPVDLNKTGTVDVNSEKAFEFYVATPDGQPVLDFPTGQRFRAACFHSYDAGRWERNQSGLRVTDRAFSPPRMTQQPYANLPDLGPGTVHVSFILNPRLAGSPPVADPVAWRAGMLSPVLSRLDQKNYWSWVHKSDGSFDGALSYESGHPQYLQAWAPPVHPGESPVARVATGTPQLPRGLYRLKEYSDRLVERLVDEGALPPAVLADVDPVQNRLPQYHEAIARAFEHHLAASGEFSYTLDLTRKDKSIDPAEDFLLNTRSGHCQRFASALALMLRSQGIPAQMVLGYRGCTGRGDGWYEVHEDQAHAWVEVLLPAKEQPFGVAWEYGASLYGTPGVAGLAGGLGAEYLTLPSNWKPMYWLTLDPTPAAPEDDSDSKSTLLEQAKQKWEAVLKALLLAYNRDSRQQAADSIEEWLTEEYGWLYLVGAAVGLSGLIAWRRRARKRSDMFAGFPNAVRRLAAALTRAGYAWPAGTTAREFATTAGALLAARLETASVANVPAQLIAAYYAERFGEQPPTATATEQLESELRRLESALS